MSLLGKIRNYNSAAAKELENANFRTDSEIKSLDRTDLYELFPEKKNLKLRKDIIEIIHPKRPVEDLVRELKGFIPHESAWGVCSCLTPILLFKSAVADLSVSRAPETRAGNSSDLLPSVLREVKYNMIVDGQTLNAHQQLMNELLSQQQVQDCQFSESSDDHQVTLLFKSIGSHIKSDIKAAMSRIKDNKPVILVLMHHVYEPKSTSSPRILKDHPNVVLTVHVFVDWTEFRLLTCRENSAAIFNIRDKLLEYSRPMISGENLQGVSERRNLEAEGGGKKQHFYDDQKSGKKSSDRQSSFGFFESLFKL